MLFFVVKLLLPVHSHFNHANYAFDIHSAVQGPEVYVGGLSLIREKSQKILKSQQQPKSLKKNLKLSKKSDKMKKGRKIKKIKTPEYLDFCLVAKNK